MFDLWPLLPPPQLAGKYDPHKEEELRLWIQDVTGKRIGDNFMESLKDGVQLCEWVEVEEFHLTRTEAQKHINIYTMIGDWM